MATKALCIGINDYPGTDSDLSGCVSDANDWANLMKTHGFAVSVLLDAQATKAAMTQAIGDLITGAQKGDALIVTYSGHGTWVPDASGDEPDGRDEALCPHDLASNGPLLDDDLHALFANRARGVRFARTRGMSDPHSAGHIAARAPRLSGGILETAVGVRRGETPG